MIKDASEADRTNRTWPCTSDLAPPRCHSPRCRRFHLDSQLTDVSVSASSDSDRGRAGSGCGPAGLIGNGDGSKGDNGSGPCEEAAFVVDDDPSCLWPFSDHPPRRCMIRSTTRGRSFRFLIGAWTKSEHEEPQPSEELNAQHNPSPVRHYPGATLAARRTIALGTRRRLRDAPLGPSALSSSLLGQRRRASRCTPMATCAKNSD